MKKETKKIIINHPDLGKLEKTFIFTYDETKYSSLDECIADHDLAKNERDQECDAINKINTEESLRIHEENEAAYQKWMSEKPIPKQPELKKLDNSKYEGRGYISKELYTNDAPVDVVNILSQCSPEQLNAIKQLLA